MVVRKKGFQSKMKPKMALKGRERIEIKQGEQWSDWLQQSLEGPCLITLMSVSLNPTRHMVQV